MQLVTFHLHDQVHTHDLLVYLYAHICTSFTFRPDLQLGPTYTHTPPSTLYFHDIIQSPVLGHRMVVWKSYIILFGGFYEALREVKWFNDLYLYNILEQKWTLIVYKPLDSVPRPRSGFQMCVHATEDVLFIYGGYSKLKDAVAKREGRIHDDLWQLNLKSLLTQVGSAAVGGKQTVDATRANWQKISKKGHFPSSRCGAVMSLYKNKAILFGGVFDEERERHTMLSTFYNDLYAFDLERKRWYQLGMRAPKGLKGTAAAGVSVMRSVGWCDGADGACYV